MKELTFKEINKYHYIPYNKRIQLKEGRNLPESLCPLCVEKEEGKHFELASSKFS